LKTITTFILVFSLSSCATKVTTEGSQTREINKSWKNSCTFIGTDQTFSTFKLGATGNYITVRNNIKNVTAERGGNSYVVNDFSDDGLGHYKATFEIYDCPESKYEVPKKYEALEKLKELLDKGVITEEEYQHEKIKLLESHD